ncbi:hypothetical protein BC827DRAFT_1158380 [Russula dissimulans]|nr:hypothetical protein BC827DRAFT_1158380 [Russula dissimulans]
MLHENITSSSVPGMGAQASQMTVDWAPVYPRLFPRGSHSTVHSKLLKEGEETIPFSEHNTRSGWEEEISRGFDAAGVGSPGTPSKLSFPYNTLTHLNSLSPPPHSQVADMRAADEKRCAWGSVAREAEKTARDCHRSHAIDLGNFDFSDDFIIFDEEPTGSTGPHTSRLADPQPSSYGGDQRSSAHG